MNSSVLLVQGPCLPLLSITPILVLVYAIVNTSYAFYISTWFQFLELSYFILLLHNVIILFQSQAL